MKVFHGPRFERSLKKLHPVLIEKVIERTSVFMKDPFDARLNAHKLHGKLKDKWSFSVDKKNRILFEFNNGDVIFLDVGDHDIYQ